MGIPVFFKTCIEDYNYICFPLDNRNIDYLFFDLNCLIHPCCHGETDENIMCKKILDNINLIVNKVNPNKIIYIAIDGPCPKPKMQQQRYRRYKSTLENNPWDTNAISPGTKFMNKLEKYLNKYLKFDIDYILDSSKNPGEGEHKIYHYIRYNKLNNLVVYGLDADLIMLSLITKCDNIYLLRERTEYNIECIESDYIYLDIIKLKNQIIKSIKPTNYLLDDETLIYDYIFICFILGNDFIYHTPSINIRYNGLEYLLNIYNKLQNKYNGIFQIVDCTNLNPQLIFENFKEYIYELSLNEDTRIQNILYRRDKQETHFKLREGDDIKNHYPLLNRQTEKDIFKNIKTWRCNYYSYYLYDKLYDKNDYDNILNSLENINKKYFESFIWTLNYYMGSCIPWQWSYDYIYAPDLKFFYKYLNTNNDKLKSYKFDPNLSQNKPTKIKDQLNYILPDNSHTITRYKLDKKNIDIEKLKYYHLLKRYSWESIPKL
tara:strand:+ start:3708 stop:5174 length:1467 start_codon:yes stop_codon:yes gene_type:complete